MKSSVVRSRSERHTAPAAPLWRSARVRGIAWQVLLLAAVIGTIAWMGVNAMRALDERGMTSGLDFLFSGTSFPLGEGFFSFTQGETYLRAFLVGIGNTVVLSFLGIVSATVLGGAIGIARLSQNGLISGVAGGYVLLFRNSPQLVQIVFWYTFFTLLPAPRGSWEFGLGIFASNRGLTLPAPDRIDVFLWCLLAFAVGVVTSLIAGRIADHRRRRTGQRRRWAFWARVLPPLGFPLVLWALFGAPATWSVPELAGFNFRGGVILSPEFLAIYFGLTFYIAAFIAEIVRGGLRSVEDGQMEASKAIGLGGADMYRKVIVPQALRAIIPPLSAQYVSLLKNSSLAVAVGYPDLFSVSNTLLTYSGRTIEVLSIMALVYLTISLFVGALSNLANHYVQIPER